MATLSQFEELNLELIAARKAVIERDRILDIMASLDVQLGEKKQELLLLEIQKHNEKLDVDELSDDWTIASILLSLFGKREAILEKEVQGYLEAKMAFQQCRSQIASLENYQQELDVMLVELAHCDELYEALEQKKEQMLSNSNLHESARLKDINERLPQKLAYLKELDEAVKTGQVVLKVLENSLDHYKLGSLFISEPEYELNGRRYKAFAYIQILLDRFQLELTDISRQFWPAPKLKKTKPGSQNLGQTIKLLSQSKDLESLRRWRYKQLKKVHGRVQARLTQIKEIHELLLGEVKALEHERLILINNMWRAENFAE